MLKRLAAALCALLGAVAASGEAELRIGDAANGAPLTALQRCALQLALSGENRAVSMRRIPPSQAVEALRKGEFDVLVLDARFAPADTADLICRPYAAEALCVYVHPGNSAGSLTRKEVLEILTEPRPAWKKYCPMAADIQRIALKVDSFGGTLIRRVFGERNYADEIFRVGGMSQLYAFLNPASAGFAPFEPERPADVIALPVEDVQPTTATVASGRYPLALRYLIVTKKTVPPLAADLLKALFSFEARRELPDDGMIPLWEVK